MKLLLDENLSPRICKLLADVFPDAQSVLRLGLGGASDAQLFELASREQYVIVSKDSDFVDRAIVSKADVKVVRLRIGNCSTIQGADMLRESAELLQEFSRSSATVIELP